MIRLLLDAAGVLFAAWFVAGPVQTRVQICHPEWFTNEEPPK